MANVIRIAPRVSGPVIELPIHDNQRVKAEIYYSELTRVPSRPISRWPKQKLDRTKNLLALDKQIAAAEAAVEAKSVDDRAS